MDCHLLRLAARGVMRLLLILIIIIGLSAAPFSSADVEPEKVIGTNDLIYVNKDKSNIPFKYRQLTDAIGLMDVGCTVTYIGNGYAITAGHCIWTKFFEPIPETPFVNLPCKDDFDHTFEIWWGYRGAEGDKPAQKGECERIVFAQITKFYDFAILKVSNPPQVKVSVDLQSPIELGRSITVFSHAESLPLQWSKKCKVSRIQVKNISTKSIMHVCDTNPGSSGAAIIDTETLKIVGLHNGGVFFAEFKEPPPMDLFDPEAEKLGINYGTYITDSPLREVLKKLGF